MSSQSEIQEMIARVSSHTMVTTPRLISLVHQVRLCEATGIPGAYVECGVWKGGAMGLMALANLKYGTMRRDLHLFDAFTEICEPDEKVDGDRAVQEARSWTRGGGTTGRLTPLTGFYDAFGGPGSLEENVELLERTIGYDSERIHYHEGWFQDTLPRDAESVGPIAILRLDGDWYASTKTCLEHLYDQVVSSGFVISDDYGTYDGCRKAVNEFIAQRGLHVQTHKVDSECIYWIKD
jgi:O-methyltransferase